jgi:hypothetical protein
MVPKVLDRRSLFGVTCVRCGNDLIAPEKSEHLDDRRIRHLWPSSLALPEMQRSFRGIPSISR